MILGLTDQGQRYPIIGKLHKGGPKTNPRAPGPELDHWRFESDDMEARAAFAHFYPNKPAAIEIMLPYADMALNWDAWQEEWVAGGLRHRCDGVTCVRWRDGKVFSREPIPCPGGCKPIGRLAVMLPAFNRMAVVTMGTTSKHDIKNIQGALDAASALRPDLRGVPFILSRQKVEISTPTDDPAKRARREKWLVFLEIAPAWVRAQIAVMQRAALPDSGVKLLGDGSAVDTRTGEVIEGDYEHEEDEQAEEREPTQPELVAKLGGLRGRERFLDGTPRNIGTEREVKAMTVEALKAEITVTEARIAELERMRQPALVEG